MKRFMMLAALTILMAMAGWGCNETVSNNQIYNPPTTCKQDSECSGGYKCSAMGVCMAICRAGVDADCPSGQYCLSAANYCVECLDDSHCADGEYCSAFNRCLTDTNPDGDTTDTDTDTVITDGDDVDPVDDIDTDPVDTDIIPDGDTDPVDDIDNDPVIDGDVEIDAVDTDPDYDTDPDPDPEFSDEIPSTCNPGEGYCFAPNTYQQCNPNGDGWSVITDCTGSYDQCNIQFCDPVAHCAPSPVQNGTFCNDNNNLSYPDICVNGSCVAGTSVAHITLVWETAGPDLDIHLLRPSGTFDPTVQDGNIPGDCNYANKTPDWGTVGDDNDNPRLLLDDINGTGPEEIVLPRAGDTGNYLIWVRWYNGSTTTTVRNVRATVSVYTNDNQMFRYDLTLAEPGDYRQVAWMRAVSQDQVQLEAICEDGCPGGTTCTPHGCDYPCSPACGATQQCVSGSCINDCRRNGNTCTGGLSCDFFSGECVDAPPQCPTCSAGEHCSAETNYQCVPDETTCTASMDACTDTTTCCDGGTCCTGLGSSVCCPPGSCMDLFGCLPPGN